MKTKGNNDNVLSLETRVALLEKGAISIEALIVDLRNGMNRLETKLDSHFLHLDNKIDNRNDSLRNQMWGQFLMLGSFMIGGFLILGHKVFGI